MKAESRNKMPFPYYPNTITRKGLFQFQTRVDYKADVRLI